MDNPPTTPCLEWPKAPGGPVPHAKLRFDGSEFGFPEARTRGPMNRAEVLIVCDLAKKRGFEAFAAAVTCEPVSFREALWRLRVMEAAARAYSDAARKHGLDLPVSKALQEALAAGDLDRAIGVSLADALAARDDQTAIMTRHQPAGPIGKGAY